jgi:hypothetical protein
MQYHKMGFILLNKILIWQRSEYIGVWKDHIKLSGDNNNNNNNKIEVIEVSSF